MNLSCNSFVVASPRACSYRIVSYRVSYRARIGLARACSYQGVFYEEPFLAYLSGIDTRGLRQKLQENLPSLTGSLLHYCCRSVNENFECKHWI